MFSYSLPLQDFICCVRFDVLNASSSLQANPLQTDFEIELQTLSFVALKFQSRSRATYVHSTKNVHTLAARLRLKSERARFAQFRERSLNTLQHFVAFGRREKTGQRGKIAAFAAGYLPVVYRQSKCGYICIYFKILSNFN